VLTLPLASLASLASLAACTGLTACNGKVTRVECTEMLDRYIDMTVAGEPGLADLPEAEARAARDMKKALRKGDARYMRVQQQCEAEITRREYRCAMKAPSPETWQACID
jgi:hypothetical protein